MCSDTLQIKEYLQVQFSNDLPIQHRVLGYQLKLELTLCLLNSPVINFERIYNFYIFVRPFDPEMYIYNFFSIFGNYNNKNIILQPPKCAKL